MPTTAQTTNERIWQTVASIPVGRVSTYGEIARRAGLGAAARRVGRALRSLPAKTRIPWHRVLNASGQISLPAGSTVAQTQRSRLESEGVRFTPGGRVDLRRFGWE
ncbi:MAG: methylated-DNA--[protein]-cysteine S-methyltransferase [Gammaproteobacteria bacterium]|jgi:methylated-DNA-protein-cysteine methyltransferase-like protein|nr:methylated-DNA--[protein]-cysteine S-methyltransferase [Gammaproteobacteria bacterium]